MKICIVGPAYPYRGGLASIMQSMARVYQAEGHEVKIYTFTVQYPSLLFPGKTQYVTTPPPSDLHIERVLNNVNPLSWIKVGLRLRREAPDMILMKYWTPFMAPAFGTVARIARSNGKSKVICQIDNVEPHEHHIIDRPCNSYYLGAVDGFVYMSEQVHGELTAYTSAPAIFSPHPMFENFGERVDREEACRQLKLDPSHRYLLFFGLIRDYKGLDLLLEAFGKVDNPSLRLLVAGEFYNDKEQYRAALDRLGERVVLHEGFVRDEDVRLYFSVADALILPYRTATQSGITQIAYNFSVPMVVTRVGGLPEIVPDGKVGFVCEPTVEGIAGSIERLYLNGALERFAENFPIERKRFSWEEMCARLLEVFGMTQRQK